VRGSPLASSLRDGAERRQEAQFMEAPAKGCLAGLVSWKLGGGLISTVIIFLIVYALLGHC
jgi:hypothetical protein